MVSSLTCRSCGAANLQQVIDLGTQPLANNLLGPADLNRPEPAFPLEVWVCPACWLMQIAYIVPPVTLFSEYLYFSSFSDQMLQHAGGAAERYIVEKKLGSANFVVEVASNDGYFLKNFVKGGVPCLGFEPAANIAEVARKNGIETLDAFFGAETARSVASQHGKADLILANNVFAHAPEINDFVSGIAALLKPDGWAVLEFPYAVDMVEKTEFDTIYHEHVFYFTLLPLLPLFARHSLDIFNVERIPIHGGSLRIFASQRGAHPVSTAVGDLIHEERKRKVDSPAFYQEFSRQAAEVRSNLIDFLREQSDAGKRIAAYGASAKGSTLLNFVGEAAKTIEFIADRSTYKQGRLSPGLHLPIVPAESLEEKQPDFAVLLTWNFAEEIMRQQRAYSEKGGKFVIPLPELFVTPS